MSQIEDVDDLKLGATGGVGDFYREPDDVTRGLTLHDGLTLFYTPGKASLAFDAEVAKFLELQTEEEWRMGLDSLIAAHGKQSVESWKDSQKHKQGLIHLAVKKNYAQVLKHMVAELGFDVNVRRDSDQCTPMHLAMFHKNPASIKALQFLGADLSLKNTYGKACAKYAAPLNSYQNIIWLDMKMSYGHDEGVQSGEAPRILEAAVIVTDKDLNVLGSDQWVIGGFTKEDLEAMPAWHQRTFRDKGPGGEFPPLAEDAQGNCLFSEILASQHTAEAVETAIVKLIAAHCPEQACPIAGNSIQCDRNGINAHNVLKVHMPKVYAYISHEILDVSTVLGLMNRWFPEKQIDYKADQQAHASHDHRALRHIESSIQSFGWARANLFVQPVGTPGEDDNAAKGIYDYTGLTNPAVALAGQTKLDLSASTLDLSSHSSGLIRQKSELRESAPAFIPTRGPPGLGVSDSMDLSLQPTKLNMQDMASDFPCTPPGLASLAPPPGLFHPSSGDKAPPPAPDVLQRFSTWPQDVVDRELRVENKTNGDVHVYWPVDARKLQGKDRQLVSRSFTLFPDVICRLMIKPKPKGLERGMSNFKKSSGCGSLELKLVEGAEKVPAFSFSLSIGSDDKKDGPRGPVHHDFSSSSVCVMSNGDDWDFKAAVDEASGTFLVCLTVQAVS